MCTHRCNAKEEDRLHKSMCGPVKTESLCKYQSPTPAEAVADIAAEEDSSWC